MDGFASTKRALLEYYVSTENSIRSRQEIHQLFGGIVPGNARVWTIGRDGVDDEGDIEEKDPKDRGYRIFYMDRAGPQQEKAMPGSTDDEAEPSR